MEPYYADDAVTLYHGDALAVLRTLPDQSVNSCVTSPPYFGLRDYGELGQYGLEASPAEYVETMRVLFAEVRRVLADDGTLWLNLGDSYASPPKGGFGTSGLNGNNQEQVSPVGLGWNRRFGVPHKNLLGMPWRVAFALRDDGWFLRSDIIWAKRTLKPEAVTDRPTRAHEYIFLLTKYPQYWYDGVAIREVAAGENATRNARSVWLINSAPFPQAHFAVMPPELAERCILAGCRPGGTVLDPFSGSGTTGMVAQKHGRKYVGIDLNKDYLDLSLRTRLQQAALDFSEETAS